MVFFSNIFLYTQKGCFKKMQLSIFLYAGIVGGDAVAVFWGEDEDDESSMKNVDLV